MKWSLSIVRVLKPMDVGCTPSAVSCKSSWKLMGRFVSAMAAERERHDGSHKGRRLCGMGEMSQMGRGRCAVGEMVAVGVETADVEWHARQRRDGATGGGGDGRCSSRLSNADVPAHGRWRAGGVIGSRRGETRATARRGETAREMGGWCGKGVEYVGVFLNLLRELSTLNFKHNQLSQSGEVAEMGGQTLRDGER
jgi:hypothetical protein